MITVKGRFDGKVVILTEPAPVDHEADVTVSFAPDSTERRFHWIGPADLLEASVVDAGAEVVRQRRME